MGKKKIKKRQRNTFELLIRGKAKHYVKAIKDFWKEKDKLQQEFNATALSLEVIEANEEIFPSKLSNKIWLCKDGAVFMRYKTEGYIPDKTETIVVNENIQDWSNKGIIIPFKGKDIQISSVVCAPGAGVIFQSTSFNDIYVDYIAISSFRYDQPELAPSVSKAIVDFRLTLLGMILQTGGPLISPQTEQVINPENVIDSLKRKLEEFRSLLEGDVDEERLQSFLKENPFLLKPVSEAIPKKKLGEDFITDFVLLNILDQGPIYTLVELERSSHQILTKDLLLASSVNRAIKQTKDWDIWLEKNKAYLQNKLHCFESPQYLIVIGRSSQMTDEQKAYLRSYNRGFLNLNILTYDDIIARTEEFIESARRTI